MVIVIIIWIVEDLGDILEFECIKWPLVDLIFVPKEIARNNIKFCIVF